MKTEKTEVTGTSGRNRDIFVFFLSTLLLFIPNCSMVQKFADSSKPYHTGDYKANLDEWTREARIHRGLEVELILSATFKSKPFRRAYAHEYAAAYKLNAEEKKDFIEDHVAAADMGYEFLLAAFVPQEDWDDFDDSDSMWRLRMVTAGEERIRPTEIRRIKEKDALLSHFFPYITPWKSVYIVRFPPDALENQGRPSEKPGPVILEIAGVRGSTRMEWRLENREKM